MVTEEKFGLEKYLLELTQDKFTKKGYYFGLGQGNTIKKTVKKLNECLVQAFASTLYAVVDEISLNDLTHIVLSQAQYLMGISLVRPIHSLKIDPAQLFNSKHFLLYQTEIHQWLIHLEEHKKLPGKYEMFLGKFSRL